MGYLVKFLARNMIKLKDTDISYTAIDTWMGRKIVMYHPVTPRRLP